MLVCLSVHSSVNLQGDINLNATDDLFFQDSIYLFASSWWSCFPFFSDLGSQLISYAFLNRRNKTDIKEQKAKREELKSCESIPPPPPPEKSHNVCRFVVTIFSKKKILPFFMFFITNGYVDNTRFWITQNPLSYFGALLPLPRRITPCPAPYCPCPNSYFPCLPASDYLLAVYPAFFKKNW